MAFVRQHYCHANGHTNASTHLAGDVRPQEFRHRLDTPSLRGVNILDRGSQVHFMAEFQELFDFPPAPFENDWCFDHTVSL